jgi:uncharacterized phiE125 gp8 family phage protein
MTLELTSGPVKEPITLAEAKKQCVVEHDNDDVLFRDLISAARAFAEEYTKRAFVTQQWRDEIDSFESVIDLSRPPLVSVDEIGYIDSEGAAQVLSTDIYRVTRINADKLKGRITLKYGQSWPSVQIVSEPIYIEYTAGYGTPDKVPSAIKRAMLLLVNDWYENRGDVVVGVSVGKIPNGVKSLLNPYRLREF